MILYFGALVSQGSGLAISVAAITLGLSERGFVGDCLFDSVAQFAVRIFMLSRVGL